MTLFPRLFNKTQSPMNAGTPPDATATEDEDSVHAAAVAELGHGDELLALALSTSPSPEQRAAQQRVAQLIDSGAVDFGELCSQTQNQIALLSIASLTRDPARLDQMLGAIDDPEFFFKLAIEGPSSKLRQLAAERIQEPAQLKRLLRDARGGKDKNVYKIVKRKCDDINAREKHAADTQASIVALCGAIERHSFKPFDAAFVAGVDHFSAQWNALEAQAPLEIRQRATQAIERCREIISNHVRAVAVQAAQASAIANADAQRQSIITDVRKLLVSLYETENADSVSAASSQLAKYIERWNETKRYKAPAAEDTARFDALAKAASHLLQMTATHGALRQQLQTIRAAEPQVDLAARYRMLGETLALKNAVTDMEWPADVAAAETALKEWEQSRADKQEAAARALKQVTGLIRRAHGALNDGKSAQATGLRRAIAEALDDIRPVPANISSQLDQLDRRLGELQDWRSFAVAPKRIQLIEQMESLIGSEEEPNALAEQIKKLQEEWKSISKGTASESEADWQRFHRAAQAAYQPCHEHFAAQAKIRQENLQKRKHLLAKLVQFESSCDWAHADWREVAKVLRNAKQDWRTYNPTERAAGKAIQKEFDALADKIQGRLDAEYAANIERKKTLIAQAQRLTGEKDTRKAIDEIKRLQGVWKNAGVVPHFEDQRLWEEFRQHCDAIYKKSQEEYQQLNAELQGNKDKAVAVCAEAEQLAGLSGPALFEAAQRIRQLREGFEQIGDLPKANANELNRRFERAIQQYDRQLAQQRARDEAQSWDNLFAACNEVRLLQLAASENSDAELEARRQSVRAFIDGVRQWPKGGLQAIENKLSKPPATTDVAANEAALRMLCIRAEILTDTPTPPADLALRRNYQLQSLVQGMGRSTGSVHEQLQAMTFEWIGTGATGTEVYGELFERFRQCRAKMPKKPA